MMSTCPWGFDEAAPHSDLLAPLRAEPAADPIAPLRADQVALTAVAARRPGRTGRGLSRSTSRDHPARVAPCTATEQTHGDVT